ncbi:hypothetical protein B0T16DRAFT_459103 [Cercophora newfieldiana]|uniref:Uncharacterized protein n=1 Tax=Cercophora newfieldiana TaxID=92897 RepID=A0AA39Y1N0_9PEZI|nr:hypothetical protein B0T16DRAFT_459103 [Cercophora newfieldiana]
MRTAVALSLLAIPGTLTAPQARPIVVDAVFRILTGLGPAATPFCIHFLNQPRTATRTTTTTSTPVTTVLTTTFTSTLSAATNCDATTTTTVIVYPPPPVPPFRPSAAPVVKRAEAAEAVTVTVPPALAIFQPSIVSSACSRLGTVVFPYSATTTRTLTRTAPLSTATNTISTDFNLCYTTSTITINPAVAAETGGPAQSYSRAMCQKIYALFRCADFHAERSESRDRFKHIKDCATFESGLYCEEWRRVHAPDEDEIDKDCPECRGERPQEPVVYHKSEAVRPPYQLNADQEAKGEDFQDIGANVALQPANSSFICRVPV